MEGEREGEWERVADIVNAWRKEEMKNRERGEEVKKRRRINAMKSGDEEERK